MINFTQLDNATPVAGSNTAYQYFRFNLILAAEGAVLTPYRDTHKNKLPTIGIGFNLTDDTILALVLKSFGIDNAHLSRIKGVSIAFNSEPPCHVAHALD